MILERLGDFMAQDYPPLRILETLNKYGRGIETTYSFFKHIPEVQEMSKDKILWYFFRENFFRYSNPIQYGMYPINLYDRMDQHIAANLDALLKCYGYDMSVLNDPKFNIQSELRDYFVGPILWNDWSAFKQVYKPDMYFADALLNTENFQLSKSMIEHLPCNTFYIDVSDCKQFGNVCGILVYVFIKGNNCKITMELVAKNLVFYSCYVHGNFNEQGIIDLVTKVVDSENLPGYRIMSPTTLKTIKNNTLPKELFLLNREEIYTFALQMISYLSLEKPQITESDLTKDTYRYRNEGSPIRNKWSEVTISDVGVRYGNTIRTKLSQEEIAETVSDASETNVEVDTLEVNPTRKSPTPHFRSAHWHRYWVGEGRKELRVNWIEPTFVGSNPHSDVVIHKVI